MTKTIDQLEEEREFAHEAVDRTFDDAVAKVRDYEEAQASDKALHKQVVGILHREFCGTLMPGSDLFTEHDRIADDIVATLRRNIY